MAVDSAEHRCLVSGLKKGLITRYDTGIKEEDDLGYFFHNQGCKIDAVRLVLDTKTERSRGFGFLDFEDAESLQKALVWDGRPAPEITGNPDGKLRVEVAKPASQDMRKKHRELQTEKNKTMDMERGMRLREARVNELGRELQRARDRQSALGSRKDPQVAMKQERKKQEEILKAEVALKAAEDWLSRSIQVEEERCRNLEGIIGTVDGEQTQRHLDHTDEPAHAGDGEEPSFCLDGDPEERDTVGDEITASGPVCKMRIRNTFLEYYIPQPAELVRTLTAPANMLHGGVSPGSPSLVRDISMGRACNLAPETPSNTPWSMKRAADGEAASVSRQILEEKIASSGSDFAPPSRGAQQSQNKGAAEAASLRPRNSGTASSARWADVEDDESPVRQRLGPERRRVRFKNVPNLPAEELKAFIMDELERVWKVARGRPPPEVIDVRVVHDPHRNRSWAQLMAPTELVVHFADVDDANWMVHGRQLGSWSRAETISLRGRVFQAEWDIKTPTDWRQLRYHADTDASSEVSYGTVGSQNSFSSAVARRSAVASARPAAQRDDIGKQNTQGLPVRNRTVLLEGLPKGWPERKVREEVLELFRRMWKRDKYTFDPKAQLHSGGDGAIVVRRGRDKGDGNSGSCLVRLRSHLDAKWVAEDAGNLSIAGVPIQASWARPRPAH